MSKWRKKQVIVEAVRVATILDAATKHWVDMPIWIIEAYDKGDITLSEKDIEIKTLEGTMIGNWGDWIIQGVRGEIYPCRDDIFRETYEFV